MYKYVSTFNVVSKSTSQNYEVGSISRVGSMAYSTNSYLKNADFYVFWDSKWVISST